MPELETISVTLPADLAAELRALVEQERYFSPSQVIVEALEDWQAKQRLRQERLESVRARIAEADAEQDPPLSDEEVEQHFAAKWARALAAAGENA